MPDFQFINRESQNLVQHLTAGDAYGAAEELRRDSHMLDPQTFHDLVRRTDELNRQFDRNPQGAEIRRVHRPAGQDDLYVAMRGTNMGYPAGHMMSDMAVPISPPGYGQPGQAQPEYVQPGYPPQGPVVSFMQPRPNYVQFVPAECAQRPAINPGAAGFLGAIAGAALDHRRPFVGALAGGAIGALTSMTINSIEGGAANPRACQIAMARQQAWEQYSYQQQVNGQPVYSQYAPSGWQPAMGMRY